MAERLRGRRATVNLIPYNPIEGALYGRPSPQSAERFRRVLTDASVVATVRWSRGVESDAACGQLRVRGRWTGARLTEGMNSGDPAASERKTGNRTRSADASSFVSLVDRDPCG